MKPLSIVFMLLVVSSSTRANTVYLTNRYDHVQMIDGAKYDRVTLQRIEAGHIVFIHNSGIAKVHFALIPDEILSDAGLPTRSESIRRINDKAEAEKLKAIERAKKEKIAKEELKIEIEKAKRIADKADLVLLDWNWSASHGYTTANGRVGNLTENRLQNVQAVVSYFSDDCTFIASDSVLIEYNPLMPGQASPFQVILKYNPLMTRATIAFKEMLGPVFTTIDKETFEKAVMELGSEAEHAPPVHPRSGEH